MKYKRLLALFLSVCAVLGMLPLSVSALGMDESIKVTHINPLYADVMTEEDLVQPGIMPRGVITYHDSIADAGAQLREAMKARTTTVQIGLDADLMEGVQTFHDVADAAFKHTGVSTEGDYLKWQYGGWSASGSGYGDTYTLTYTLTYYTTVEQEAEVDIAVEALLKTLDLSGSDYDKICEIYDYICDNITYDYVNTYKLKHTAYAALINGTAVCQGYAVLFYRLALEAGVDARLISGIGNGGGHAWNIVELDGLYYNVDATWDAGWYYYDYFLRCEAGFEDHSRDAEYETEAFHAAYPMSKGDYAADQVIFVTGQPQDAGGVLADKVKFTVVATGYGLTYQWQERRAGGSWKDLSGSTKSSVTITVTNSRDDARYRCVITDADGFVMTSDTATLTVEEPALTISSQPQDAGGALKDRVVFRVAAQGDGLTYQWQERRAGGSWKDLSGSTKSSVTITVTNSRNNAQYRCVITDAYNKILTSDTAVLTVEEPAITINTQPQDASGVLKDRVVFRVTAEGNSLTYQWQERRAGGSWKDLSGSTKSSVTITVTTSRDNAQYRCVITDADNNTLTSDAATLTVQEEEPITLNLQPMDASGALKDKVVFKVTAQGNGLTYQWQERRAGGSWKVLSGSTKSSVTITVTTSRDGARYRCIVTDSNGNQATSNAATLTVEKEESTVTITAQPKNTSGALKEVVTLTVSAKSSDNLKLRYQWQERRAGGTWANFGAVRTAGSINVTVVASRDGAQYRCIVTDSNGNQATSNAATLTVE